MPPETDENALLRAMMYQQDEDPTEGPDGAQKPATARPGGIMSLPAVSSLLRTQDAQIKDLARQVKRLEQRLRAVERQTTSQGRAINDMDVEIGNKLDKRTWDQ